MPKLLSITFAFLLTVASFAPVAGAADAAANLTLPPIEVASKDCTLLTTVPLKTDISTLTGKLIDNDADKVTQTGQFLVLAKAGHAKGTATIEYALDGSLKPAQYQIWTSFSAGGVDTQQFTITAGPDANHLTQRTRFAQSDGKSWKFTWRKSPALTTLFPGDRVLRVTVSGFASQQKNIGAFLLVPVEQIPADMDAHGGALRAAIDALPTPTDLAQRIDVLEAVSASSADRIFAALDAAAKQHQLDHTAIDHFYGPHAAEIARSLHVSLPAIVVMNDQYAVQRLIGQPASEQTAAEFLTDTKALPPIVQPQPSVIKAQPLISGHVAEWAVVGTWSGPGGLSLWGIDAESDMRPSAGDPCIVLNFDAGKSVPWTARPSDAHGVVVLDPATPDVVWAHGSAYANVYLSTDHSTDVALHIAYNGIGSYAWLDGKPIELKEDAHALQSPESLANIPQPANGGVTDQGNRLSVGAQHFDMPRLATFTLQPGWHRLLVKLIVQMPKGGAIRLAADLTRPDGSPLAGVQTSAIDPETPLALHTEAAALTPLCYTDAPFNLAHPGEPVRLKVGIQWHAIKGQPAQPAAPFLPFKATLHAIITDYDGHAVAEQNVLGIFPGDAAITLAQAFPPGYYGVHLSLHDDRGQLIAQYPPDGFSVIGGTAAQEQRKAHKKVAVTYYFMAGNYKTLFFPYMKRMGIYRNVGGQNGRALDLYQEAKKEGISLVCDLWTDRDADYLRTYITETAPYVDAYKGMNEIDIRPDKKGTPEYWVAKEKRDYELIHTIDPTAIYIGGSLVRVGNDPWFKKCLELGLDRYQDAWDVHAYPQKMPDLEGVVSNSPNESEMGLLNAYKQLGKTNDKPFWLGETGARASHGVDARRWQAESVAKLVAWVNSRSNFQVIGFLVPWWYSRSAPLADVGDIEVGHMPGEAALYTANALIDGLGYRRVPLGESIQAAWFGPTFMAWTTGQPCQASIPLDPKQKWIGVDVVGRTHNVNVPADGKVMLSITQSPQYLLPQAKYDQLVAMPH